ncbi:hypothetical protein WMY93_031792 [Mugilogobius chulae]|uniref:Ion transport domain-containing protein n=1 Tax=Mugilogobius chulae TaxID=88201 RepID=A0AAW0MF66_9GOBI
MTTCVLLLDMFIRTLVDTWFLKVHQERELQRQKQKKRRRVATRRRSVTDRLNSRYFVYFEWFVRAVIAINLLVMAFDHYGQPKYLEDLMEICFYVLTGLFMIQLIFKTLVLGIRNLVMDRWSVLDVVVLVVSVSERTSSLQRRHRSLSECEAQSLQENVLIQTIGNTLFKLSSDTTGCVWFAPWYSALIRPGQRRPLVVIVSFAQSPLYAVGRLSPQSSAAQHTHKPASQDLHEETR